MRATNQAARLITLNRQYAELDHLLSQVNAAVKTAESVHSRGISADVSLFDVVECLRSACATVRYAADETGRLIDAESEGG